MELITGQNFKRTAKYIRAAVIIACLFSILLGLAAFSLFTYAKILGAPPLAVPQSTIYFGENGEVIGESDNGQKRYWVKLDDISKDLIDATIAVEDQHFYKHYGFDMKRIAGAVVADIRAMAKVQGASTITQQYARNLFLEHDKTWQRKITEAFYTLRLEMNYSKKEILEGYLNTIYYGHRAYGVEAASQYYFNKSAKDLTLAEASMLAGIPKGPASYSPLENIEKAKKRQAIVLKSMKNQKIIKSAEAEAAKGETLALTGKHPSSGEKTAPYFQDAVKQALKSKLGLDERTIELGGLKVYTTLNKKKQKAAEEAFDSIMSDQSKIQAALIAMNPKNGEVEALIGGRDYKESSFNRSTQAVRQPGSTIKPLLYYAALEKGFTPSTTLRSEKTTFTFDDGASSYTPHNFNHQYANGNITLAQAIALSDNVYAVKTHMFLGEDTLVDTVRKFGLSSKMSAVPSLALGTSGVRMLEMVNAYGILANGGKKVEPVFIKRVENHKGDIIYKHEQHKKTVLDPDKAYVMTQMLTGIFDKKLNGHASVTGTAIIPQLTRPYAGKSGTTPSDSWMIGYTPQLVAGVWAGFDHSQKIEATEDKSYAKKIWARFMEYSLEDEPVKNFKPSENVTGVKIDPANGLLATEDCPAARMTYFEKGTEPTEYCTDHIHDGLFNRENRQSPEQKKGWYKKFLEFWKSE
ncbi:monofunctional biosynthetic peptidoglycan transglycosylase [Bacillus sp. M6-12]|uniref:transglycosylase domain-containing protein n=1 Tax=Bacillus sp. M6-12 TaxID=2054166 RepID=UPI000C780F90|nr:PBP1A family penicillin-binding protein [Bacillus sp. M6-12]PLS18378.1 monofunctional biosynthetic peptidoglycan transglycosylase [Bacillus sp. M6-12]